MTLLAALILAATPTFPIAHMEQQLAAIGSDTALVYQSQAIDEYPLWSPDGRFLAVNEAGQWKKIDLGKLELIKGTWRDGQVIGVTQSPAAVSDASAEEIALWLKSNKMEPRRLVVNETVIELGNLMSTSLIVTPRSRPPEYRWRSASENCHSLVASSDKAYVAFICEMNGVFALRLPK